MRILTVSNRINVLTELNERLSKVFPKADLIGESDPLMAGKYSFNNAVDAVFADVNMKRMTGLQLLRFIRREQKETLTYLVGTESEIGESLQTGVCADVTGVIPYPFTDESFVKFIKELKI